MNQVTTSQETQTPAETYHAQIARYDAMFEIENNDLDTVTRHVYTTLHNGDVERMLIVGWGPERAKLGQPGREDAPVKYVSHETLTREHQAELKGLYRLQLEQERVMGATALDQTVL